MNFDSKIESLVRFRNHLKRLGPTVSVINVTLLLVWGATIVMMIAVIEMTPAHHELPPLGRMLSFILIPVSDLTWDLWTIIAVGYYGLLLAMILPELFALCREKLTGVNVALRVLEMLHWILVWSLWVISYIIIVLIYTDLVWLISVL